MYAYDFNVIVFKLHLPVDALKTLRVLRGIGVNACYVHSIIFFKFLYILKFLYI